MNQQNLHYELTKQRTDQSMHSRGALASYERLDTFLRLHSNKFVYNEPSLHYFVWVDGKQAIMHANELERKLFSDFGAQKKRSKGLSFFKSKAHYEEVFDWSLDANIKEHLKYVDDLGSLPNLEPRPPLSIVVSAEFWLKNTERTEAMKSHVTAWFSPSSNKASFTFNFPHSSADGVFTLYRKMLQADCPVTLEDAFFYVRTTKGSDHSLRRAF